MALITALQVYTQGYIHIILAHTILMMQIWHKNLQDQFNLLFAVLIELNPYLTIFWLLRHTSCALYMVSRAPKYGINVSKVISCLVKIHEMVNFRLPVCICIFRLSSLQIHSFNTGLMLITSLESAYLNTSTAKILQMLLCYCMLLILSVRLPAKKLLQ